MSTVLRLDPLTLPLDGMQVIEASAGTGKTWTLAALYLRLVLGHGRAGSMEEAGLMPPQILVMTFTDAATAELRGRIRERLAQAGRFFQGGSAGGDAFLRELRDGFAPAAWPACVQRLEAAAQWMDDAAIFTIHGWSSRMLRQHAFDSASLFQQSRVDDGERLRLGAVQDYWRRWFYAVPAGQLGALRAVGATPQALLKNLRSRWSRAERDPGASMPPGRDPQRLLQDWGDWCANLQALEARFRAACTPELEALLDTTIAAKRLTAYRKDWPGKLRALAGGEPLLELGGKERAAAQVLLQRFGLSVLQDKGWQEAAHHPVFADIGELAACLAAEPQVVEELLDHAAAQVAAAYASAKSQLAQFDFSDLLQCLYAALQAPDGRLAEAIRAQYPVAMVDEFQDTDPWQYGALHRIYGARPVAGTGLLMIGDPKQAIYSFRGADLATYLAARQQARAVYTLSGNYRSTPALVAAVNHVFQHAERPFGEVDYETVQACNGEVQPLQVGGVEQPAMTVWYLPEGAPARKAVYLRQMAELFAARMVELLRQGAARPGQMAVLVHNGPQARAMRAALSRRGVRSVYLSERDSVFATAEALDLWRILAAVVQPRATDTLRAALATGLWGLPFADLEALLRDEAAWDALVERFHGWNATWQRQGFLPMLYQLLHDQAIPRRLLNPVDPRVHDGERRLSNLLHLGDLLQTASASLQGEAALLRHLEQQIRNPQAGGESAELRLESDAQLVQVITIHKSKGLQYPLVFLPFASAFRPEDKDSGRDDAARLDEDVRLLYVALTRAERALWIGLAPARGDMDGSTPTVRSAVSRLLQRVTPGDLTQRLDVWAQCGSIRVAPAPPPDSTPWESAPEEAAWKPARQARRLLASHWWSASFSALARELPPTPGPTQPLGSDRDERIDDALVDSAQPLSGGDAEAAPANAASGLDAFPAGSSYGTLLHDLLEWQFAQGWPVALSPSEPALETAWRALLARKAQRLGLDAAQQAQLHDWVRQIARQPLSVPGAETPLVPASLDGTCAWAEMAFTLAVQRCHASVLDGLITRHVLPGSARPALQDTQLEGLLVGFMDLVLEHEGRYYVLDYKSNRLPGYAPADLASAMLAHRYDAQYVLYLLALHRLLRHRLAGYDYDRHVGGALYLFLRGVGQGAQGLFAHRPPRALIEGLDRLLAGAGQEGVQ